MKTLELKDIAGYLPYELNVISKYGKTFTLSIRRITQFGVFWDIIKPILRPLTDLTKPCIENGKIPIVEMAKISSNKELGWEQIERYDKMLAAENGNELFMVIIDELTHKLLRFSTLYYSMKNMEYKDTDTNMIVELYDFLHQHHFDYRGLIKEGLAIDINTI